MLPTLFFHLNRVLRRITTSIGESLADFGGAMVWPIERAFAVTFGRMLHSMEGFDRVEDWLFGLLLLVTWPVRFTWRMLVRLTTMVIPARTRESIGTRFDNWILWRKQLGPAIWRLVERLNLDAPVRWLIWLLQPVWRPAASVCGFLYAWAITRPFKQMLWGMPVLVLLLPIGGAVIWGLTWGRESVAIQYRSAVDQARDSGNFLTMQRFERKLEQLGVDSDRNQFDEALKVAEQGKLEKAYERMTLLAPDDDLGYPPAHHWIVVHLLGNLLEVPDDDRLRLAEIHLRRLTTLGIKNQDIEFLEAALLSQTGRLEEAAALLEPHINRSEAAAFQRLEIDLKLNRREEAIRDARALDLHFEQAQRDGKAFDSPRYQAWAQAQLLLGDSIQWAQIVRKWITIAPASEEARKSVALLNQREFNEMLQSTHPSAEQLAIRLSEAVQFSEDPAALEPLIARLYERRNETTAVAEMFRILAESAETPPALAATIGTAAAIDGDAPLARRLLAQSLKTNPENAVAWNNYGWALSQEPDRDLQQALDAVNRALELSPDEFRFRETRGQILIAMERWREAVDDLEFALNGMPDLKPIHVSLAIAYEHLGQTELANIHRQQVE